MRTISRCSRRKLAADVVAQELGAFAHRGERRLELVRNVAQEAVLLLLEIVQARAQPFEPLPEVAQVLRAVDLDRVREVGGAHLADRLVELANRPRDQHGEQDRQRERDAAVASARYSHFWRPCVAVSCSRSIARSVSWLRRGEHRLRAVGKPRVAVGELRRSIRRALRHRQQLVQPALAVGRALRARRGSALERKQRELARRLPELLPQARVIVEQRAVVENQMLAHEALERRRLLEELPAGASCLRRLLHRLLALRLEPVERKDELAQRIKQRQAHQQEAEQDELRKERG